MNGRAYVAGLMTAVVLVVVSLGVFVVVQGGRDKNSDGSSPSPSARIEPTQVPATRVPQCGIDTINRAARGVVRLENRYGSGSGFLISDDLVVTNQHVTDGVRTISVQFSDSSKGSGEVIAESTNLDVAVVRLSTSKPGLAMEWGKSKLLKSTQTVVVVGYPSGATGIPVLTKGSVSRSGTNGLGEELVQTDAAVNVGNSGGPLIDECGLVVGIVTWKNSRAEGVGYAQAENQVRPEIERLVGQGIRTVPVPTNAPRPSLSTTPRPSPTAIRVSTQNGLEDAVQQYYAAINKLEFATACGLLSARHRSTVTLADWRAGYQTTLGVTVESLRRIGTSNQVEVALVVVDRASSGIVTRRFSGQWNLVQEGSTWRLDSAQISQKP